MLSRLRLPDGRTVVAKHIAPALDWMMRATADSGRAAELWVSGAMERCPPTIDPALFRIEDDGGDGWWLYMRDVRFHRRGTRFSTTDAARLLGYLADLHAAFWDDPPPGLCSLADLLTILSPRRLADADAGFAKVVRSGWEVFAEVAPEDVAERVFALLDDPAPLVGELAGHGTTLLHSDPHFGNAVLLDDRLVLVDWTLAACGPPAVDFVWFLDQSYSLLDASHDDVVAAFLRAERGRVTDRMVDVACLAQLLNAGWQAREAQDPTNFDWFVRRARRALG